MFAFVFRLVTTSPSSEHKTIKTMIFKESCHLIFQKIIQIPTTHWKKVCFLCIKLKKGLAIIYNNGAHQVFYIWGSLSFSHSEAFEWPHHSTSVAVYVQIMKVTLWYFIEVSVPSQKRVNDHVCACCAYRLCLEFWNSPDEVALSSFS